MLTLSATDLAIALAKARGTLRVEECQGRMGQHWALSDEQGILCVALSAAEAAAIVERC